MKKYKVGEKTAHILCMVCASITILAIIFITVYMIMKGTPALQSVGVADLFFGTIWRPTAVTPKFGILYVILSSIVATFASLLIGVPIGILTAVFLSEIASKKLSNIVSSAVELLAAIPSVIYGLVGMMVLNPFLYEIEKAIFRNDPDHIFTGGSNILAAIIVLAIMILPTVISVSTTSLKAVNDKLRSASLALGATKIQTIFKVVIPAAKSGILTAVVLGVGRAIGEAMAVNMVAGGSVNLPLPFNSVRLLTTQLVSEMSYSEGLHRQVLFTVGLVLYAFILIINFILLKIRKKEVKDE
ncbi:MAG: phosphate ABC transporter permease subunit PstC [Erysipelotrichaceae bacterium]